MSHLRSLLPYFRPYRRGLLAGLVLVVVANIFTVAGPWLLRLAIDGLGDPGVTRGRIATYAGLIVGAALLGGAAKYGMRELLNGISRRMECDLREDLFRHLLKMDATFYGSWRTGDLMSRATNDTLAVRQAAGPAVMYAVNTTVISIFALSFMVWISPRLTALALVPMIFLPPVVLAFGRVIHQRFERIQDQFSNLSTLVQENLTGVRLVRAYVQEADQARRFRAMNAEYLARNLHLVRAQGLFHPILGLLTGTAMVIVLWIGGGEVMRGAITVGDFVAFTFYLNLLTWPLIALGWVVNLFQRGEASMGRLNAILHTRPGIVPGVGRHPAPREVRGAIEFRGVGFRYPGTERPVLRNLSFRVEAGETVAVVGPTGAGKSTLVSLLARIHDPTEGVILLDGVPLVEHDPTAIRAAVGMVPQDAFLFSDTLEANLGLGLAARDEDAPPDPRVREAAQVARLHEQVEAFPRGYDTYLGERGINLSGGQKQRATLARALARDPRILILDDALSAVDTHTETHILEGLRTALSGRTAFIISHRVSAVMHADRILVLDEGELVESGTHAELLARGGTYASLLRRQLLEAELEGEAAVGGEGAAGGDAAVGEARAGAPGSR
jgi:ATP-binding cassette, subfamily B, multidrug efflux pump